MIRTPDPLGMVRGEWQTVRLRGCAYEIYAAFRKRSRKVASSTTTSAITSAIIWLRADQPGLLQTLREREIDFVLDMNLAGRDLPVADLLRQRHIACAFSTDCGAEGSRRRLSQAGCRLIAAIGRGLDM